MAKRRKLETPTAEDLGKIEEEFRRETPAKAAKPPIAQIAAEVAGQYQVGTAEMRRDEAQAAAYRVAEGQGRLIKEIDLDEIEAASLQRDRTVMDEEALAELEHSISENGLRLPIEVYALKQPKGRKRYGLLSGYRRLIAQRNLLVRTDESRFATIKTVLRDPDQMGGAFVAMVEENEIRQDLSHYERGRIAAIAAQQGAFDTTEAAVAAMFAAASKAKRSKIRSFARVFEELGDVLQFPEGLREKDGLKLAQALRGGAAAELRERLGTDGITNARAEWAQIEKVIADQGNVAPDPKRGGRPKTGSQGPLNPDDTLITSTGVTLRKDKDGADYVIRLSGKSLPDEVLQKAMQAIKTVIESPSV